MYAGYGHRCHGCPDALSPSSNVVVFPRANAKRGSRFSASQRKKIRCEAKSCLDKKQPRRIVPNSVRNPVIGD